MTSRAVSLASVLCSRGMRTSAGLELDPGMRALSSLVGERAAVAAAWKRTSLKWLCLKILSPSVPQGIAWSPYLSLTTLQAGHCPVVL